MCLHCKRLNLSCEYKLKPRFVCESNPIKNVLFVRFKQKCSKHQKFVSADDVVPLRWKKMPSGTNHDERILYSSHNTFGMPHVTAAVNDDAQRRRKKHVQSENVETSSTTSLFDLSQNTFLLQLSEVNPLNVYFPSISGCTLESQVFSYFVTHICPSCICYPDSNYILPNPYSNTIIPLALKSNRAFKAVVAAGLTQLVLFGGLQFQEISRCYIVELLNILLSLLANEAKNDSNDWDEILTVILMLCFLDISLTCGSTWMTHLKGAKSLIKRLNSSHYQTSIRSFFTKYFIVHDIMGRTAWSSSDHSNNDYIPLNYFNDFRIDLVIGCCPYLIFLVDKITDLGKVCESFETGTYLIDVLECINRKKVSIQLELGSLRQFYTNGSDSLSSSFIHAVAEIRRLTVFVYLFARVDMELRYLNAVGLEDIKQSFLDAAAYTDQIINMIDGLGICPMTLLWSLFIVGVISVERKEQRQFVLRKLSEMEKTRNLANVRHSVRVIKQVFLEKDMNICSFRYKDIIKGKTDNISLA